MMETTNNADGIGEFSPEGHVIIVIGPQKRKLLVDSCVLERLSIVFAAIFKWSWKECRALRRGDAPIENLSPWTMILPSSTYAPLSIIRKTWYLKSSPRTKFSTSPSWLVSMTLWRLCHRKARAGSRPARRSQVRSWFSPQLLIFSTTPTIIVRRIGYNPSVKAVDLAYYNAREVVIRNIVELTLINSADSTADGLIKPLNSQMFGKFMEKLHLAWWRWFWWPRSGI